MTEELSARNRITILNSTNTSYTHTAYLFRFGIWQAIFSCNYHVEHGILSNAKVVFINAELQKVVGWDAKEENRELTEEESAEEARMDAEYGLFKVPRSESISLCTSKFKGDHGFHFLALWMYIFDEEAKTEFDVTAVAKKVVEGQPIGLSETEEQSLRMFVRYNESEEEEEEGDDNDDDHDEDDEEEWDKDGDNDESDRSEAEKDGKDVED